MDKDAKIADRHYLRMKLRLKYWRKARNMTLEQVADGLNVSHVAVSRWETGSRAPTVENLAKLAKLYRVPPGLLFEDPSGTPIHEAADIVASLSADKAAAWLAMGRALTSK